METAESEFGNDKFWMGIATLRKMQTIYYPKLPNFYVKKVLRTLNLNNLYYFKHCLLEAHE